jgi:hypothetical protein
MRVNWIGAVIGFLLVGSLIYVARGSKPEVQYYSCGFPIKMNHLQRLGIGKTSHCCLACQAVSGFKILYMLQEMHKDEKGCYATSLQDFDSDMRPNLEKHSVEFQSDGKTWWACLPKQERLSGNYLLTSEGRLYLSGQEPPQQIASW